MMMMKLKSSFFRYYSIIIPKSHQFRCFSSTLLSRIKYDSTPSRRLKYMLELEHVLEKCQLSGQEGSHSCGFRNIDDALVTFDHMLLMRHLTSISDFNKLLIVIARLMRGGHSTTISLCKKLEMSRIRPDVMTMNIMIHCFCSLNCVDFGLSSLGKLLKLGHEPDKITFSALVKGLCDVGKVKDAIDLVTEMEEQGYPLDITVNIMINCFCYLNYVNFGFSLVGKLMQLGHEPDTFTFNTLMKGQCDEGKVSDAVDMLDEMLKQGYRTDEFTYATLINGLCRTGNPITAIDLLRRMELGGFKPNIYVYNAIMDSLCKNWLFVEALDLTLEMFKKDIRPDVVTYTNLIWLYSRVGEFEEAKFMYDLMTSSKFPPNVKTYNMFVRTICKKGSVYETGDVLVKMAQMGIEPNVVTYSTLINGYCFQRDMKAAFNLFRRMPEKGCEPNVATYNAIIKGFLDYNDTTIALKLLSEMVERGVSADEITIQILSKYSSNEKIDSSVSKMLRKFIETLVVSDVNLKHEEKLDRDDDFSQRAHRSYWENLQLEAEKPNINDDVGVAD